MGSLPSPVDAAPLSRSLQIVTLLLTALLLTACEEDVVAVLNTDRPYSMYGYLDPRADTQWVAVFTIEDRLEPIRPEPIDGAVTSTHEGSGVTTLWRDSTYRYEDGSVAHLFWTPMRVAYGQTYRLEARRSDGASSAVTVTVPPLAEFKSEDPIIHEVGVSQTRVRLPVLLEGAIPQPRNVKAHYFVKYDTTGWAVAEIVLPYDEAVLQAEGGWRAHIDMNADFVQIRQELIQKGLYRPEIGISLLGLEISAFISNEVWPPLGESADANLLANPGVFDNIDHGFGFVGSGYTNRAFVTPPHDVSRKAGFVQRF